MNILLIAGGWSNERNVSLSGAKGIEEALKNNGHKVTFFDLLLGFNSLLTVAKEHDFAFINLHGAPGEDGLVQAMLDSINIPYQGSHAQGSFLALNKAATKQIYQYNKIPTPKWEFLPTRPLDTWQVSMEYPIFVKSNTGGSSLLLFYVQNEKELHEALESIFNAGEEALIEEYIEGQEVTCGILGNEALPPVLIRPLAGSFFNYDSKYQDGAAEEICPAPLPSHINENIKNLALKAHKALGLRGYSRTDFRVNSHGEILTLETNTLPGMTATSLIPQEAKAIGLEFGELLEKLIELSK